MYLVLDEDNLLITKTDYLEDAIMIAIDYDDRMKLTTILDVKEGVLLHV